VYYSTLNHVGMTGTSVGAEVDYCWISINVSISPLWYCHPI